MNDCSHAATDWRSNGKSKEKFCTDCGMVLESRLEAAIISSSGTEEDCEKDCGCG